MESPHAFNPHLTLGALQIGVLVSTTLFGVMTAQTYIYYSNFASDSWKLKAMVAFVWICEFGQTICVSHTHYLSTITFYGHPEALAKAPKSLSTAVLFSGFIGPLVQAYFAWRIWKVSKSIYIPIFCWSLSFLRFVGSVVAFVEALKMNTMVEYEIEWEWLLTSILAVGAAVDLIVAGTLVFYLTQQRGNAYKTTRSIIDKLIAWTIETGLVTSIAGFTMLIFFIKMKDNYIWLAIFMFLARLFSNSLLAALNSRTIIRAMDRNYVDLTPSEVRNDSGTMQFETPVRSELSKTSAAQSV